MPNVELEPPDPLTDFRRISLGTWRRSYDPQVYGTMTLRAEPVLDYIDRFRRATGARLTVTHVMTRAVARALHELPEANALIRFNRIQRRRRVSIFLQVALRDPATGRPDLSGVILRDVDKLDLRAIVERTEDAVARVRDRTDPVLERTRRGMRYVPPMLLGTTLRALSFLLYNLNLDLRAFGLARDAFGSAMVTNIGSLGLEQAFVPLVSWSRVPICVALGAVRDTPVVERGEVVPGKVVNVSATFDHRYIDGLHAARLVALVRDQFARPDAAFGPIALEPGDAGGSARVDPASRGG